MTPTEQIEAGIEEALAQAETELESKLAQANRAEAIAAAEQELRIARKARDEAERWVTVAEIALLKARGVEGEIERYTLAWREAKLAGDDHAAWVRLMAAFLRQNGSVCTTDPKALAEIHAEAARQEAEHAANSPVVKTMNDPAAHFGMGR